MIPRREFIRASALAAASVSRACALDEVPKGRTPVRLWFSYGGTNRQVLEELVRRFNQRQARDYVQAVYQGDYFEGLAKLRTAIAARCAPALSHVVGEVVPYLARAQVLEPLAGYPGLPELDVIPELGQERSWLGGGTHPLVALPFNRSTPIAYVNGDLFAKGRAERAAHLAGARSNRSAAHRTGHSLRLRLPDQLVVLGGARRPSRRHGDRGRRPRVARR